MTLSALDAARGGDGQAFADLTGPYVAELRVHCYRMLGSLVDAEDVLQETLLAAWQGLGGFAGNSSLRTWLYRIATNRCLNAIRATKRRRPPEPIPPFVPPEPSRRGEVTWLQPYPDTLLETVADRVPGPSARHEVQEAIELAFIAALQRLPPRQTAALLLCDVLGFATAEAAAVLETTPNAVKGALQRARAALAREPATRRTGPVTATNEDRDLAARFAEAFAADDIEGLLALLSDDVWLAMPPAPHEYHGPEAVVAFLRTSAQWRGTRRFRLVLTRATPSPPSVVTSPTPTAEQANPPASSSSPPTALASTPSPTSSTLSCRSCSASPLLTCRSQRIAQSGRSTCATSRCGAWRQ